MKLRVRVMLRTAAWAAAWLVAFYVWTWLWSDQSDHLRVEVMLWWLAFLIALGLRYEIEMIKEKLDLR